MLRLPVRVAGTNGPPAHDRGPEGCRPTAAPGSPRRSRPQGVKVPAPEAVTDIDPVRAGPPVAGPQIAPRRPLSACPGKWPARPEQVRRRGRELVAQHAGRIDTGLCGHRVGLSKDHAVAALTPLPELGRWCGCG